MSVLNCVWKKRDEGAMVEWMKSGLRGVDGWCKVMIIVVTVRVEENGKCGKGVQ